MIAFELTLEPLNPSPDEVENFNYFCFSYTLFRIFIFSLCTFFSSSRRSDNKLYKAINSKTCAVSKKCHIFLKSIYVWKFNRCNMIITGNSQLEKVVAIRFQLSWAFQVQWFLISIPSTILSHELWFLAQSQYFFTSTHFARNLFLFHKTFIDFSLDFGTQFPSLSRSPNSKQKSTPIFFFSLYFWLKVYLTLSAGALILTERHYTFCKEPTILAESHFFSRSPYFWRAVCCEGLASFLYVLIVSLA